MLVILILLKIGILLSYSSIIFMIYNLKKKDDSVKVQLDLLSRLEVFAVIGLNLIGVVSVINHDTYVFTCGLCILGIVLVLLEKNRLIIAGDKWVILKGKQYRIKNITRLETSLFTLKVYIKENKNPLSICVPLTSNEVIVHKINENIK